MDIIGYLYYKGLLYTGLKRYEDAIEQFTLAISFPANCTHKVHVESFKKLTLLSLIVHGKLPQLPKHTSNILKYKLENAFPVYKALAHTYLHKEDKNFFDIINANYEDFDRDRNWGLVQKLRKMYPKVRICELSSTYLTLSFR